MGVQGSVDIAEEFLKGQWTWAFCIIRVLECTEPIKKID